jgi:hypothetical protein
VILCRKRQLSKTIKQRDVLAMARLEHITSRSVKLLPKLPIWVKSAVFSVASIAGILKSMEQSAKPTIRDLYPRLDETELKKTEENLDRYLALVLRIFERLESENHPQAGQLTGSISTLGSIATQSETSVSQSPCRNT